MTDPELSVGPPIKPEDMDYGDEGALPDDSEVSGDDGPSAVPVAKPVTSGKKKRV